MCMVVDKKKIKNTAIYCEKYVEGYPKKLTQVMRLKVNGTQMKYIPTFNIEESNGGGKIFFSLFWQNGKNTFLVI